jgi:N-methylhydantoinase A
MKYRLGCDIGGTFTDFVLLDEETGAFEMGKVLTTPDDPSEAVDAGIGDLLERVPRFLEQTENVIHGTTLVINAIIQRQGASTALITTKGFRDIIAMRREMRYDTHDIAAVFPAPIVSRAWRREVDERVHGDGRIATPLDEEEARAVLDELVADGVESVAVCLLHSYANPANEQTLARVADDAQPQLSISLSSDVMPEIKEFERTSTTILNAYVQPLVAHYLERLEGKLRKRKYERGLFLMLSGGGMIGTETARQYPVRLVESGPVGGALAAAYIAERAGIDNVLSFDMGGTTAKACFIRDGQLPTTTEFEVDRIHRFKKGSGTPLAVPTVDVIEIGAGGGSIAAINELGVIQVGPQSAGADPGPICYGRGGTGPTITDADLVLGYLDANYFLGGAMKLDLEAARRGVEQAVANPLGMSVEQAVWGIHEVVNENMASAARIHIAEKGGDFSNTTLIAFGGAGPVHADGLARKLGATRMLVPRGAGVFSALGFVVAPVSFEVSRTHVVRLDDMPPDELEQLYRSLESEAAAVVRAVASGADIAFARALDLCYRGQGSSIRLPLSEPDGGMIAFDDIATRFTEEYMNRYGYAYEDMEIQIRTLRVTATAEREVPKVSLRFSGESGDAQGALKGERPAYAPQLGEFVSHKVYAVDRLGGDARIDGPAIFEEEASTLVMGPGASAMTDPRGWILVTLDGGTI